MATTPICSVDATGIHRPTFQECLTYVQDLYKSIYGQDVYIEPDSQDGQFLGSLAQGFDDANGMAVAVYNAFSPTTAQGVGLSSIVKLVGIARAVATRSTATIRCSGVVGTIIDNGVVTDVNGVAWYLPAIVVIPPEGYIDVTAVCGEFGDIRAAINEINEIFTSKPGWQEAVNVSEASPGAPIELDGQLRQRQAYSASLPALGPRRGLQAAIAALPGVRRLRVYENNAPGPDSLGIPGYSVAVVTDGGSVRSIIETLALKKGSGVRTFGTTVISTLPDDQGFTSQVYYSPVVNVPVSFHLVVKAGIGFTTDVRQRIMDSLADWTQNLGIGTDVQLADAYRAARLYGAEESKTYKIIPGSLTTARDFLEFDTQDDIMAYNEAPYAEASYVNVEVT